MASKVLKKTRHAIETLSESDPTHIVSEVGKSLRHDLGIAGGKDFLTGFLGIDLPSSDKKHASTAESVDSEISETRVSIDIVNFKKIDTDKAPKAEARIEAAIDYHRDILRSSEKISKQELSTMASQIEQIKQELISLIKSSKLLQNEVASVTVDQSPAKAGIYHAHFFEWMLGMIRKARENVESSESWMNAQKGKDGKKGYWGMFKKHGTSFALSNERGVATQVG